VHATALSRVAEKRWYHLARWRHPRHGLRALCLARDRLCVECRRAGVVAVSTEVDHVIPHRGDPVLFWDLGNVQGLCTTHHAAKTHRGE